MNKAMWRRYGYYLRSTVPLLTRIHSPLVVLRTFLRLPGPRPFLVRLRDKPALSFWVRSAMDLWVLKEVCLEREYERFGFTPQDGWRVLDIGAGLGEFALWVAALCPQAQVYAYEPFPPSFDLLDRNIRQNGLTNVHAFPYAVGPRVGRARLESAGREAVMVQTHLEEDLVGGVRVVSLPEAVASTDTGRCDLLKMDCEGCEYELLLRSEPQVWSKVDRICLEYHEGVDGHRHDELVAALEQQGYQVQVFPRPTHPHLGFIRAWRGRARPAPPP